MQVERVVLTFMADVHLGFHGLEVIGQIGLDFTSHSLAGPLPKAVELAVHFDSRYECIAITVVVAVEKSVVKECR